MEKFQELYKYLMLEIGPHSPNFYDIVEVLDGGFL